MFGELLINKTIQSVSTKMYYVLSFNIYYKEPGTASGAVLQKTCSRTCG